MEEKEIKKRCRDLFWKLVQIDKKKDRNDIEGRFWIGGRLDSLDSILKYIKNNNYKERWE